MSLFSILSPERYWERSTYHSVPRCAASSNPLLTGTYIFPKLRSVSMVLHGVISRNAVASTSLKSFIIQLAYDFSISLSGSIRMRESSEVAHVCYSTLEYVLVFRLPNYRFIQNTVTLNSLFLLLKIQYFCIFGVCSAAV